MTEDEPVRNEGYDDLLDAIGDDDGYYLQSESGNGWLPPRRLDPWTGSTDLKEKALPDQGTIETYTVIQVPPPAFEGEAPYVLAIADFGDVKLTGQLQDSNPEDVEIGMDVEPAVGHQENSNERFIAFKPKSTKE